MISIKGLRQGLLIVFSDEHVPWLTKLRELEEKLVAGSSFFQGAHAAFDVRGLELGSDELKRLLDLASSYSITPFAIIGSNENTRRQVEALGLATRLPPPQPSRKAPAVDAAKQAAAVTVAEPIGAPAPGPDELRIEAQAVTHQSLSDAAAAEAADPAAPVTAESTAVETPVTTATIANAVAEAEEHQERGTDGALIKRRIRSGQIIRHPGHIVVVGDVNPGARIEAGGDIIVWGKLQGTAHAGAFGNAKAVICALEMTPNLVKIADLIIRNHRGKAEMAAIKEQEIVFTRWESKS